MIGDASAHFYPLLQNSDIDANLNVGTISDNITEREREREREKACARGVNKRQSALFLLLDRVKRVSTTQLLFLASIQDFGRRLQRDITRLVKKRVAKSHDAAGSATASGGDASPGPSMAPDVYVASHPTQRFAVWFGGTVIASTSQFSREVHTKADYDEYGPSICRSNPVSAGLV